MKKIIFTEEQQQKIISLYLEENYSLSKIGEQFHVSKGVISRLLTENNIKKRKRTHIHKGDYDIFEDIDTPEKAYWLGFIAADGCISIRKNNATIKIALARKDKGHLEKI